MDELETREALRAAFESEALPHLPRLLAAARRLAPSVADAEDLVQETVLRAYRTYRNFRRGTNSRAWLLTILHSVFLNRLRRSRLEPVAEPTEQLESHAVRAIVDRDWEATILASATAGESGAGESVEAALRRLPADYRAVVLLVDLEGFTYEEAASALSAPVGTIRSRLSRARRLLAGELADYAREMGYSRRTSG